MKESASTSAETDVLSFGSCSFCPTDKLKSELYKCSKCGRLYCSVRCFRSKAHVQCSESFYREQCLQHVGEKNDNEKVDVNKESIKRPTTTFEQYMEEKAREPGNLDEERINPAIPLDIGADEEILFDSDDEPEYLDNITELTMKEYESMDDEELNRKLTAIGLPIETGTSAEENHEQLEKLYQHLDEDEKKKFVKLADRKSVV